MGSVKKHMTLCERSIRILENVIACNGTFWHWWQKYILLLIPLLLLGAKLEWFYDVAEGLYLLSFCATIQYFEYFECMTVWIIEDIPHIVFVTVAEVRILNSSPRNEIVFSVHLRTVRGPCLKTMVSLLESHDCLNAAPDVFYSDRGNTTWQRPSIPVSFGLWFVKL